MEKIRESISMWDEWRKLYNFIHFLYLNGTITLELHDEMIDTLMWFKIYAMDEEDKLRGWIKKDEK
jgi:hypothetical protein